ncbi:MAG TPA: helix-turn-helix domain-containing protein [Acidimicrobiales bacterium]|jgi:excisionase family DNA binding protein
MTTRDVAAKLNVSVQTVLRYIASGALPAVRLAREYRVTPEGFDEFVATDAARVDLEARKALADAIADGRLPEEPPPEVLHFIASVIKASRRERIEQADRPAS